MYKGKKIVVVMSGGALLLVLLLLLSAVATPLNEQDAQQRVRQCLQRELGNRQLQVLRERGVKLPDRATALQWQKEMQRVDALLFEAVTIKRPVPDMIFRPFSPTYVVRVIVREEESEGLPRYFWISWSGIDREVSKTIWYFSL